MTTDLPMLRTSERGSHDTCPQQWWWAWREGLQSRGSARDALWFGTGIHLALASWYCGPGKKRGPLPAETWGKFAEDSIRSMRIENIMDERTEKEWIDLGELGTIMLEGYVALYGRDEHKLIISPEQKFTIDIPWPKWQDLYDVPEGEIMAVFKGTFDSAWRDAEDGFIYLDEHKTYGSSPITGQLPMNKQFGGYWAISERTLQRAGLISGKDRVRGIEYNGLRKAKPDDRPKNAEGYATNNPTKAHYLTALEGVDGWSLADLSKKKIADLEGIAAGNHIVVLGEVSKVQSPPLFVREMVVRTTKERATQLLHIQNEAYEMRLRRDNVLPIRLNPGRHCQWCDFEGMCRLKQTGGNWEDYRSQEFAVRDPYADHRKSTEE